MISWIISYMISYIHLESWIPAIWRYKAVCSGTSRYVRFWRHGGTSNLKMVCTDMEIPRSVRTGMFWYVLSCTVMVQGGTRWYKVVHDSTRNGTWRYMEVHSSTRICKTVHSGMYWNILILTVQSGSSWIRCCNAARPKALY